MRATIGFLLLYVCLVQILGAEESDKMQIELQEIRIEPSAAQRQYATFVTLDQNKRQIVVQLTSRTPRDVNSKNVVTIIRLFPATRDDRISVLRGRITKPKGKLRFLVPKDNPEEKLSEWEISRQTSFPTEAEPDQSSEPK